MTLRALACLTLCGAFLAAPVDAATLTLTASRDNTLFSESGALSNGAGDSIFVGRTNSPSTPVVRRGLIAFDVASVLPAGAIVEDVRLTLRVSRAGGTTLVPVALHRMTADWGEGGSASAGGNGAAAQPGDATWTSRFYPDAPWTTSGGDYLASASATTSVGSVGDYTWRSAGMIADVQAWLAAPSQNHGWMLIGNEATASTARRFDSSEAVGAGTFTPELYVEFTPVPIPASLGLIALGFAALVRVGRRR